jgi:hypothetical protein
MVIRACSPVRVAYSISTCAIDFFFIFFFFFFFFFFFLNQTSIPHGVASFVWRSWPIILRFTFYEVQGGHMQSATQSS